jgi:hypothetical protein
VEVWAEEATEVATDKVARAGSWAEARVAAAKEAAAAAVRGLEVAGGSKEEVDLAAEDWVVVELGVADLEGGGLAVATVEVRAEGQEVEVRVVAAKVVAVAEETEGESCRECTRWHLNGNSAHAGPCNQRSCSRWSTSILPGRYLSQTDRS